MTAAPLVVAFPARNARDWDGRRAWGRDAHLLQALGRCAGAGAPSPVAVLRTRPGARGGPRAMALGDVPVRVAPHPVEVPGWTRRRAPARLAASLGRWRMPTVPDAERGVILCCDLLRHDAAERLAAARGWPLVTDLMDDWRRHESMPAWHRWLEEDLFPRLPADGHLLTSVTARAAAPRPALVVPNAGHHEGEPEHDPAPGPSRPVAAFVGTIHPRLDAAAMSALVRALPGWDVVAAGPVMDAGVAARLVEGGVRLEPWWDLREIDRRATVVVAPYASTALAATGDPLKVYEATARGVPCVSTMGVERAPETGLVVAGAEGFPDAVLDARALDRREVVRAARATGSWEDRARRILDALASPRAGAPAAVSVR